MTVFDLIGIQINITDSWPSDQMQRKKLKQTSDYIEIIDDLKECAALAHYLTIDLWKVEMDIKKGVKSQPSRPGALARSIESSLLSKYARCFNSSQGRTRLDKELVGRALSADLLKHHESMLNRRDKVIAHAEDLEGRQPIRVLNKDDPPADWNFDNSFSSDPIPRFTAEESRNTELCCKRLARFCYENAKKSFYSFTSLLTENEAEKLRKGHYLEDATGSAYPVIPPASSRK